MSIYTEEHEMFRKALRKMLDKEAYPYFEQWEKDRDIPREFLLKLGENGFLCPMVSEEYGGCRFKRSFQITNKIPLFVSGII